MSTEPKKTFNWTAFFFHGLYYVGYGNIKKGALLTALFVFLGPIVGLGVMIYAGIKANQDLPIDTQPFSWPSALITWFISFVLMAIIMGNYLASLTNPPSCDNRLAIQTATDIIEDQLSSYRSRREISSFSHIKGHGVDNEGVRSCSATIISNQGRQKIDYIIYWESEPTIENVLNEFKNLDFYVEVNK